jgi:hypothetical protein
MLGLTGDEEIMGVAVSVGVAVTTFSVEVGTEFEDGSGAGDSVGVTFAIPHATRKIIIIAR